MSTSENSQPKKFQTENALPVDPDEAKKVLKSEFAKRVEAAKGLNAETVLAEPIRFDVESPDDLHVEGQVNYIIKYAHRNQNPPSDRPAFMICGAFPDDENAFDHLKRHQSTYDDSGASWLGTLGSWHICCRNKSDQESNPEYQISKRDRILTMHKRKLIADREDFQTNATEKKTGAVNVSMYKKREKAKVAVANNPRAKALRNIAVKKFKEEERHIAQALGNDARKGGQMWAVVSFLCDSTPEVLAGREDPEPLIRVYGCFPTPEDAETYRKSLADDVKNYDMDVVMMYEWLFPEDVDLEKLKELYRNENQNEIMNMRKSKKTELASFEKWCKSEGIDAPETIVEEDGEVSKTSNTTDVINVTIKSGDALVQKDQAIAALQKKLDEENAKLKVHKKGKIAAQVKDTIKDLKERQRMLFEQKRAIRLKMQNGEEITEQETLALEQPEDAENEAEVENENNSEDEGEVEKTAEVENENNPEDEAEVEKTAEVEAEKSTEAEVKTVEAEVEKSSEVEVTTEPEVSKPSRPLTRLEKLLATKKT